MKILEISSTREMWDVIEITRVKNNLRKMVMIPCVSPESLMNLSTKNPASPRLRVSHHHCVFHIIPTSFKVFTSLSNPQFPI